MKKFIVTIALMVSAVGACAMRQAPPVGVPTTSTPNPIFYVPYAIHQSHPVNCTDGYGMSQPGGDEPDYDTLIGISNQTPVSQTARVKTFNQSGVLQLWSGVDHKDITLASGHSIAYTYIHGNPYADSPQDWKGYITVESITGGVIQVTSLQGGGGCFPAYWNTWSAAIPAITGPIAPRSTTYFPYMNIVWIGDANHPNGYATGIAITNFDTVSVVYKTTYTVGDGYTGAGAVYSWTDTLAAGHSISFDVYTRAHAVGYTATLSEGSLRIDAQNANGAFISVKTGVYYEQADGNYSVFSAGYGY